MLNSEIMLSEVGSATAPIPPSLLGNDFSTVPLSFSRSANASAVAFVDGGLAGVQTLVDGLAPHTAVYVLNPNGDELSQMSQVLAGYRNLSAVSLFSHGSAGAMQLGQTHLTQDSLVGYAGVLQSWSTSLHRYGKQH
jgi:hypothetical protein